MRTSPFRGRMASCVHALCLGLAFAGAAGPAQAQVVTEFGTGISTSSISFSTGQTRANNDLLQLASDGSGSFRVQNAAPGGVDFLMDVTGYFK